MTPIKTLTFWDTVERSKQAPASFYIRLQNTNLLLALDCFFVKIRNKNQDWDYFEIDSWQSVISLHSLHCRLQNSGDNKRLFLDWVALLSRFKHDYYERSYGETEIIFRPFDMTIPNIALPQREDKLYAVIRIIAGNRYIMWNPLSNTDMIMHRYKSKSDDDYLVSIKTDNRSNILLWNRARPTHTLCSSNISRIIFILSSSFFDREVKMQVKQYSYYVLHVIRESERFINFGICLSKHAPIVEPALHKALFELLNFKDFKKIQDYPSYINKHKKNIAKEMSKITKLEYIRHGEVFYSYTISGRNKIRVINKQDIYISTLVTFSNYLYNVVIIISSRVYQKIFYRSFDNFISCEDFCLHKFKNFLVTAILDKNTKVLYHELCRYLFII